MSPVAGRTEKMERDGGVPATLSWLRVYQQSHPELFHAWH